MRTFQATAAALCLLAMTAGSALAQKVTTDHDRSVNFTQYKTYRWLKEPKTQNPLMRQRIIQEINDALQARGLRLVTTEDADLAVAAHVATRDERTLNTFYDGFGGRWRFGGFGFATTTENVYEVDTLIVDIFDSKTRQAIWRATASKSVSGNPEKNTKSLSKAVDKMFEKYPPSPAS